MNLRYISLFMDYDSGYKDPFRDNFNLNTRFISNYLSIHIRRLKVKTNGDFNMISVVPSIDITHQCRIVGDKALQARVSFNKENYEIMGELERNEYRLQLLEEGYQLCKQHRKIPLEALLNLHNQFREESYKNEWLHKRKKFKEYGIEVVLKCYYSSYDFKLVITVKHIGNKNDLISGVVIKTLPDEVYFDCLFKDVIIENNELIITEYQDRPKFTFLLKDIYNGNFNFKALDAGIEYHQIKD